MDVETASDARYQSTRRETRRLGLGGRLDHKISKVLLLGCPFLFYQTPI